MAAAPCFKKHRLVNMITEAATLSCGAKIGFGVHGLEN